MDWAIGFLVILSILLSCLLIGAWVPIALAAAGIVGLVLDGGWQGLAPVGNILWNSVNSFTLTPIPMFVLMGEALLVSGVGDRFYRSLGAALRTVPGGVLHANVVGAAVMSALNGVSVATAATIGRVALPELERRKYDPSMSLGSLAGGGTLGILIPPSIPLILYGVIAQESIVRLFTAGVLPGIMVTGLFMGYILVRVKINPALAPVVEDVSGERPSAQQMVSDVLPVAALIVLILGGMFGGLMTPTEAAAVGAAASLVQAAIYRRLDFSALRKIVEGTVRVTCMILFIVAAAQLFSFALERLGVSRQLASWIVENGVTPFSFILITALLYVVMGFFFDPTSILLITMPILLPTVTLLQIDLVWFGILLVVLIETGLITPPIGLNLFVIKGVAPQYTLAQVARGSFPYVVLLLVSVVILALFPQIVLWLPNLLDGR